MPFKNPFLQQMPEQAPQGTLESIRVTLAEGGRSASQRLGLQPANEGGVGSRFRTGVSQATGMPNANDSCCPNLTLQQRVQGCVGCFVIGFVISMMGFFAFWTGNTHSFAIFYTAGNIVAMSGSCFLMGPRRQFRNMFAAKRIWATAIYFMMMVVTLAAAFMGANKVIILLCVFCQWSAAVWYIASYIPFGQKLITRFFQGVTKF